MRIVLVLALSLAAGCTIKVDRLGPMGSSMATSWSGESASDEIEGSLLYRTRAAQELQPYAADRMLDPNMLADPMVDGPQMLDPMFLDPTLNGSLVPLLDDEPQYLLNGPVGPGGRLPGM